MNRVSSTALLSFGLVLAFAAALAIGLTTDDTRIQLLVAMAAGSAALFIMAARQTHGRAARMLLCALSVALLAFASVGIFNSGMLEMGTRDSVLVAIMLAGFGLLKLGARRPVSSSVITT